MDRIENGIHRIHRSSTDNVKMKNRKNFWEKLAFFSKKEKNAFIKYPRYSYITPCKNYRPIEKMHYYKYSRYSCKPTYKWDKLKVQKCKNFQITFKFLTYRLIKN